MADYKILYLPSNGVAKKFTSTTDRLIVGAGIISDSGAGLTIAADTGSISLGSNLDGGDTYKITSLAAASSAGDALAYGQSSASLAGMTLTGDLAMGANNITITGTVDGKDVSSLIAAISEASDTAIAAPAGGHLLIWDGTDSWDNVAMSGDVTISSTGVAAIGTGVIVDADVSGTAEIAVSKLADGAARQVLQTDAAGTGVEWTDNVDLPGTLDVTGAATLDSTLGVTGQTTVAALAINGSVTGTSLITDTGLAGASNTSIVSSLAVKTYVDNNITGLQWKDAAAVLHLVGNATVATINGLSPTAGDAYVVTDSGTITSGSISAVAGDVVEYSGSVWVRLIDGSGGFVPAGTRAILATQTALITPYTDATDDGKIVSFSGSSNTGSATGDAVDSAALLIQDPAHVGYYDNLGYVFEGTVPTGSWIQFTGAGQLNAGAGLTKSGNTLDVGAGNGISVAADSIAVTGGTAGGSVVAATVTASGVGFDVDAIDGTGLEVSGSTLRLSAQGNGIAGGAGSTLSVQADSTTGGNTEPVTVGANGVGVDINSIAGTGLEADGSANLRIAAAAAGDGLTGGAGSALAVNVGNGLEIATDAVTVTADVTTGANTQPVAVSANGVGVDINAIAGTGLEADGSANLRIAAAAAGDGLTGGGGSALAVNISGDFGLQIDTDVVKVQLATNGGLAFSTGLTIDLDGTTLSLGAGGISVAGLPSLFTVNGTAVGATVTAANLDTLTDGSNADSLHVHASGGATEITISGTADVTLAAGQVVAFDNGTNGNVTLADANGGTELVNAAGFANAGAAQADPCDVQINGAITVADAYWVGGAPAAADIGKRVYLSETAGSVTMTAPTTTGSTVLRVGYISYADASANTTQVAVDIGEAIVN